MLEEVEFAKLSKHMGQSKETTAKSACDLCMVICGWSQQEQAGTMWVLYFNHLERSGQEYKMGPYWKLVVRVDSKNLLAGALA